jgi:hypothetical protein
LRTWEWVGRWVCEKRRLGHYRFYVVPHPIDKNQGIKLASVQLDILWHKDSVARLESESCLANESAVCFERKTPVIADPFLFF